MLAVWRPDRREVVSGMIGDSVRLASVETDDVDISQFWLAFRIRDKPAVWRQSGRLVPIEGPAKRTQRYEAATGRRNCSDDQRSVRALNDGHERRAVGCPPHGPGEVTAIHHARLSVERRGTKFHRFSSYH